MKKKILVAMLVGAAVIGSSSIASASEIEDKAVEGITVENSVEDSVEDKASEEATTELRYAIEEMKMALTKLDNEGLTGENREFITTFGSTAVERVRGFYDELVADSMTAGHVEFISNGWGEILTAVEERDEAAREQLKYAIEEMKIALTRLDEEGITAENKEYISTFGATALERIRDYRLDLLADSTTEGHVDFISNGWAEILTAVNEFEANASLDTEKEIKSGVSEDAMTELRYAIEEMKIALTRLDEEGITAENEEYITTFGQTAVERIRGYFDELTADETTAGHVEFISNGWAEILEAMN